MVRVCELTKFQNHNRGSVRQIFKKLMETTSLKQYPHKYLEIHIFKVTQGNIEKK